MTRPALFIQIILSVLVAACGGGGGDGTNPDEAVETISRAKGPNFVVVVLDDWGWKDYGHMSPGFVTPNIDAIAAEGFLFENAFLTTSSCTPSRASILMGRYPTATGAPHLHDLVPDGFSSIPEALHGAGYYTESAGKWHLGPEFVDRFDRVRDTRETGGAEKWPQVIRELPSDRPFFLWLSSFDPHVPHDAPPMFQVHDPDSVPLPGYLADTPESRAAYADYMNSVHRADYHIGLLRDALESQGLLESTWLFLLADNGAPTPAAKTTLYDAGIKTPLLVLAPAIRGDYEGLVSSVDLAPTLVELAGLEIPPAFQGKSFLPALRAPDYRHREFIFAEQNNHGSARSHTAVRSGRYLLIRNYFHDLVCAAEMHQLWSDLGELVALGSATPMQSLCFNLPPVQFFEVGSEGYEAFNLADSPAYTEQRTAMEAALDQWESVYRQDACPDIACAREIEERRDRLEQGP